MSSAAMNAWAARDKGKTTARVAVRRSGVMNES